MLFIRPKLSRFIATINNLWIMTRQYIWGREEYRKNG